MISIFYEKEGVSRLFVQIFFCLTVPKNFGGEQFSVSENFENRKKILHEMEISRFCVENFCLTVPRNFVGDPFCVSKKFFYRKFSWMGGAGGIMILPKFFCLTGPKNFVRGPVCFTKILVSQNLCIRGRGSIMIFYRNFFVSQCRKIP